MLQLRLQTAFLLLVGQVLLGGLGWFLSDRLPWAGLLTTLFLLWFVWRFGLVFRDEAERRTRRYRASAAAWTAFLSQLPGLLLLHYWAPDWVCSLWQGAFLPVAALLDRFWPGVGARVFPWLWLTAPVIMLLFTRPARPEQTQKVPTQRREPGEWVPARRVADVQKRGVKVR